MSLVRSSGVHRGFFGGTRTSLGLGIHQRCGRWVNSSRVRGGCPRSRLLFRATLAHLSVKVDWSDALAQPCHGQLDRILNPIWEAITVGFF